METIISKPATPRTTDMKKRCEEILLTISWRELSNRYFGRSSSWFYHKMNGIDGNGGTGGFTPEEAEQLRGALIDISEKIRRCAERI